MLTASTCVRAIGNLWSICLGVNILRLECSDTLFENPAPSILIGNILLSKTSGTLSLHSKSASEFLRIPFSGFFSGFCGLFFFFNIHNFN